VVVAAAGNRGAGAKTLDLPAADPYVVAVGALDTNGTADRSDDTVASFSSRSDARGPDVLAPGTKVASLRVPGSVLDVAFPAARLGDRYFRGSGTSQATAVVSGLAALLLEQRPSLSPDQVKALLERGATPVPVDGGDAPAAEGFGAVDAAASAALATPTDVTQRWAPAVLDLHALEHGAKKLRIASGSARWAGSTWSGSTWSGSTWSGSTWSGSTWSGSTWSGSTWSSAAWGG
jgi:serine protease AprX